MLKLKSFRIHSRYFTDKQVVSEGFLDQCEEIFGDAVEFIGMLNDICMPDDDDDDDEEEEDDANGNDEQDEEME